MTASAPVDIGVLSLLHRNLPMRADFNCVFPASGEGGGSRLTRFTVLTSTDPLARAALRHFLKSAIGKVLCEVELCTDYMLK